MYLNDAKMGMGRTQAIVFTKEQVDKMGKECHPPKNELCRLILICLFGMMHGVDLNV